MSDLGVEQTPSSLIKIQQKLKGELQVQCKVQSDKEGLFEKKCINEATFKSSIIVALCQVALISL
jgi:hypothetical protein